jgi:hypothetical protein
VADDVGRLTGMFADRYRVERELGRAPMWPTPSEANAFSAKSRTRLLEDARRALAAAERKVG